MRRNTFTSQSTIPVIRFFVDFRVSFHRLFAPRYNRTCRKLVKSNIRYDAYGRKGNEFTIES